MPDRSVDPGRLHSEGVTSRLQYPLKIDRYQRPYVWGDKKVRQLLNDLKSHDHDRAYYLGSILLHERNSENKQVLFVIDGQQRLTTLLLLYRKLFPERIDRERMKLSYYHQASFRNIQSAHDLIEEWRNHETSENPIQDTLEDVEITIIKTDDLDLAFTFFDSENSRGVQLQSDGL